MNNPIIERELVRVLRTPQALMIQIGLAVAFAFLVILAWPTDGQVDLSGFRSRHVFQLFGYGLLTAQLLLVPVFPATSIVRERTQGTLALLLNSPMTSVSIYFGKLLGVLGFVGLLLMMSIPAAAACYALGGISLTGDVVALYGVLALVAVQYAALGLLVSSYASSTDAALRLTYGLVLLLAVVTIGPYLFLQGSTGPLASLATFLRSISPIPAVMEIVGHGDVGGQGLAGATGTVSRFCITSIVITIALVIANILRLNQRMLDRSRAAGVMTDDRSTGQRVARRVFFLVDPQRRKAGIGPFVNPVMVKEFRCRRFGRSHWMLRLIAACALLSLGLTYAATAGTMDWGVNTIGGIMVILQATLIILLTPSLAAGLISTERESGGWPLLQMTPLSAGAIVRGKLMSAAWTLALILCATLPGYLVMVVIQPGLTQQIFRVLICLVLTAVFSLLLSAAVSSLFYRTATATSVSYSILVGLCAGTMLIWLGRDTRFGHSTVEKVLSLNPMAAALQVIELPGFAEYRLVPANWWIIGFASLVCLVVLCARVWKLTRPQ
ncbi:MAG: ABC transporter permease [Planctomycetaceae bacterium]